MMKYKGVVIYRNTEELVLRHFHFSHSIVHVRTLLQTFVDNCPDRGFVPLRMVIEDIESGLDIFDIVF